MSESSSLTTEYDVRADALGTLYEVVDGRVVEPIPMGALQTRIASILWFALYSHVENEGLGRADSEMLFLIDPTKNLQRRPDVSFVSYERWAADRPLSESPAWNVVPDLAVEVVSPSNTFAEVVEKINDYFRAGVRMVWVVYPKGRQAFVSDEARRITILDASDTLDGGAIVPGFRFRLARLFEGVGDHSEACSE